MKEIFKFLNDLIVGKRTDPLDEMLREKGVDPDQLLAEHRRKRAELHGEEDSQDEDIE